ncbi:ELM1/GtrOC1 family putative glycosyltransferase [Acinetobacter brisouii]|uniref:ELM1/GtrOC1 family putative glycosyltransferase n=1 Tax=Acinetobacter brisouii TaxID=396323 RepID=UPI00124FBEE7|nr:ELM1/GtrOC1 family putative glycosyltransferase [Acinetobacter brisouii]
MSQPPIILALTDGKAGHETQTQGIVQLLNQQQAYRVEWIQLTLPSKWVYYLLKWKLKFSCSTAWLSHFISRQQLEKIKQQNVAYIVSAGGNTLLANLLLKQELLKSALVKNIVASSLRGIAAHYFDVVFTIHASQENLERYLYYPIAPNKMSALALTKAQARSHLGLDDADQVITVLIGADTKTVGIGSATSWGVMLSKIREDYPHAKILCSTSRRTPVVFEQELAQYAQQKGIFTADDQITWVAQGQQCDIKNYICAADWVLCSPDSTSMVAEVLMSNRPLLVFLNKSRIYDVDIFKQLKFLAEEKLIAFYDSLEQGNIHEMIQKLEPKQHSQIIDRELQKII